MDRRLVAILAADVVDYSARMEQAEETTAADLESCHNLITRQVVDLGGRVFHRAGDAALAEFSSPVKAVLCAVEIQRALGSEPRQPDSGDRLHLRIGLHLADVIVSGDNLIGDGINVAARIQQTASPDEVWVSEHIFNHVRRHSPVTFEDLGPQQFKNLSESIRVYRVVGEMPIHRLQVAPTRQRPIIKPIREASIAVMPLTVSGADDQQRYFADGLTDDIIVELARFKKLFVSSRSASFAIQGKSAGLSETGRDLGVRYVLDGQVRKLRGDIKIALRLVSTQTGEIVWAERISRPEGELFDMLDTLVRRIVATVAGRVEAAEIAEARRKPPKNMGAYDCLLRGLEYHRLGGVTPDNLREAVAWFDRAIEADPNYSAAYAWRICAAANLPGFDLEADLHYAQRALELDENNAEAHRIMGHIMLLHHDYTVAEYHHRRAMELNPSDAYIKARSAAFYTFSGEPERALAMMEEARELDPFLPAWFIEETGVALYALGRYDEAVIALAQLPIPSVRSRLYQAAAEVVRLRLENARDLAKRALNANPQLTVETFVADEPFRDRDLTDTLSRRLIDAGVPA